MDVFATFLIASAAAALVTLLATPAIRRLALRLGLVDKVEKRRIHRVEMPRLGGVAIFLGMAVGLIILRRFGGEGFRSSPFADVVLFGAPVALGIGLWDDLAPMRSRRKFLLQLFLGALAYLLGFRIEQLSLGGGFSFPLGFLSFPVTMLWVSGVMNAANLIDGLDGLAAGISSVTFLLLGLFAYQIGYPGAAAICIVSAASSGAFLRFNFPPARIFMGDSGSMLLGYLLAVTSVSAGGTRVIPVQVLTLFLAFPLLDMSVAIVRRSIRSVYIQRERSIEGWKRVLRPVAKEVFSADGDHIHHRLLARGWSQKRVALTLYGFSAAGCALAIFVYYLPAPLGWLAFLGVALAVRHLILWLDYVEFSPHDIRERELRAGADLDQRPALLRRVS